MRLIREKWLLIVAALAAAIVLFLLIYNPYNGPEYIGLPEQLLLEQPILIDHQGSKGPVVIECLAKYQIMAAVKSVRKYSTDYASQISPLDVVLAWGDLNKKEIAEHIRYRQSDRWYYFYFDKESIVDQAHIQTHSANVHLIPSDRKTARLLAGMRKNDTVQLEGYLVSVRFGPAAWTSSLTREDAGDGSCEIMYVSKANIN